LGSNHGDCGDGEDAANWGDTLVHSWYGVSKDIPLRYGFAKGSGNYGYNHIAAGDKYHQETLTNNYLKKAILRGKLSLDGSGRGATGRKTKFKYELWEADCDDMDNKRWRKLTVIVDFANIEGIGEGDQLGIKTAYFSKWKSGSVPMEVPFIAYQGGPS
jgi:hypothetical protein